MRHMISPDHIGLAIVIDDDGCGVESVDVCNVDDATHIAIPVAEYDLAATREAVANSPVEPGPRRLLRPDELTDDRVAVLVTKADLRLLVALANTVEDITEEEAAAINRARFRADPS